MLKIAWRNLWRNSTRTLVTATAIGLTYAIYLVMMGIQDYTYDQMEDAAARAAGGAVLVQAAGFQESQLNDLLLPPGPEFEAAAKAASGSDAVSTRVIVNGLLSTSASSTPARLQGIDPVQEAPFQDMTDYLAQGTFLEGDEDAPLVLGAAIVSELDVALGDRVILTATDPSGEMRRALFHLTGILRTGSKSTDSTLAFTTVAAARSALGSDTALSQIGILSATPEATAGDLRVALADATDVEVLTWQEAMPDLVGFIEMDRAYGDVFALVLFVVVLFAIMNTFLMVVMERVRELGLLTAIGLTPGRVALLVLLETLFLALVAMSAGLLLATAGHLALSHWGIDMKAMYGESIEVGGIAMTDTMIYSRLNASRWATSSINVLVMVLASAAYPAFKAMRLPPAEAMRFYE